MARLPDDPTTVRGPFVAKVQLSEGTEKVLEPGEFGSGADGRMSPVRKPSVSRGQRNMPGLWFSSRMRRHVSYESLLERNRMLLLDFDPTTRSYLEQPVKLTYTAGGKSRTHTPDLLVWRTDGSMLLCNVKSSERIDRGSFPAQSEACAQFCEIERIDYAVLSEPAGAYLQNVRWLSGYWGVEAQKSPAYWVMKAKLGEGPMTIGDLLKFVRGEDVLNRPVLFSALWCQAFKADLTGRLENDSRVWVTDAN